MEEWKQRVWFKASDGTKGSNALVAKEAGVSVATVANVFNRPEVVIPETKQKVLEAVKKLRYTYNEMPTMKMCTACKAIRPFEDFYSNGTVALRRYNKNKKYLNSLCKDCANLKNKIYNKDNREELIKRQLINHRRRVYGLNEEQYNNMILSQNNMCAICNNPGDKTLHIDHCHTTGKIRGLLCNRCNMGIGSFEDDIILLTSAIEYLSLHTAQNLVPLIHE